MLGQGEAQRLLGIRELDGEAVVAVPVRRRHRHQVGRDRLRYVGQGRQGSRHGAGEGRADQDASLHGDS